MLRFYDGSSSFTFPSIFLSIFRSHCNWISTYIQSSLSLQKTEIPFPFSSFNRRCIHVPTLNQVFYPLASLLSALTCYLQPHAGVVWIWATSERFFGRSAARLSCLLISEGSREIIRFISRVPLSLTTSSERTCEIDRCEFFLLGILGTSTVFPSDTDTYPSP